MLEPLNSRVRTGDEMIDKEQVHTNVVSPEVPACPHDASGWRWVPTKATSLDADRVASLLAQEWALFKARTPNSADAHRAALDVIPLGVPSSFQHWDPYPLTVRSASGSRVVDADGRDLIDLSMGFGAVLVGHLHPLVVKRCQEALATGTLFVTPSEVTTEAARRLCARFGLEQIRFTNSGTEALMYAVRLAKVYKRRDAIVKIEGGYHGGFDPLLVSVKPAAAAAGREGFPVAVRAEGTEPGVVHVTPYNDLEHLRSVLAAHADTIAAVVMEPVLENLSIVLPDAGYLAGVRALCDEYDVLLVFDEVKTGLTAGNHGASASLGVRADLVCFAKSIAGGLAVGAFGGDAEVMAEISSGHCSQMGTYNGNPLGMAAVIAVDEIVTDAALAAATSLNVRTLMQHAGVIDAYQLPAHTVGFGVKGAVTWSPAPVRNYRDYLRVDFAAAELNWLWMLNRQIITPPGLDDQWLVSLAHTEADMAAAVDAFESLAKALRA